MKLSAPALLLAAAGLLAVSAVSAVSAEDFYCEVMAVEGSATLTNASQSGRALTEGDLLTVDDLVEVGASSYVDLAYDRDWNNVTRIEEGSSIRIRSLNPAAVGLEGGGVFAKLKSLPRESSFDVQTPTAIASVRGTEYRTTYLGGETQVENVSDSEVLVYGLDDLGQKQPLPVIVRRAEATQVARRGQPPGAPRAMQDHELRRAAQFGEGIDRRVQQNIRQGRFGKMADADAPERFREQRKGPPGRPEEGGRPGQPRTVSGQEAREKAQNVFRSDGPGVPPQEREEQALVSGAGLGEPYFPGGEKKRSGGPDPVGLPTERWQSGGSENRQADGRRERAERPGPQTGNGPQQDAGAELKQPAPRLSEPRRQAERGPQKEQPSKPKGKLAPRPRTQR